MPTNPVKSTVFNPFKYGYIVELPNENSSILDKVLDYAVSCAKKSKACWSSKFTLREMVDLGASYSAFNKCLRNISNPNRSYLINGEEYLLFESKSFKYKSGKIEVKFNEKLDPYFEELQEFISYDIEHLFMFKHKFTHLLYKLLYSIGTVRPAEFDVEELKLYLLSGDDSLYPKWAEFNRNVLVASQKELRQYDNLLQFEYTPLTSNKGKQITSVKFRVFYPGEEVVKTVEVKKEDKINIQEIKNIFEPEVKITNDCAKELSKITDNVNRLREVKKLFLHFEYIKDRSEWLKYAISDNWNSQLFTVNNLKKVEGDGLVTIQRSIYELYTMTIECIKKNDWNDFFYFLEFDQLYYSLSNEAQCFLIKEIFDLLIKYYLKFNVKPKVTLQFVKTYNYNIYNMVDKLRVLKQCNASYQKNFFGTFEKIQTN